MQTARSGTKPTPNRVELLWGEKQPPRMEVFSLFFETAVDMHTDGG